MAASQLALDLQLPPDYRAESYAVSEANRAAHALIGRWPRWRQGHLLLTGPKGSGKTHLASVWIARARPVIVDRMEISDALRGAGRGAALLVEDVHLGVDEAGLFHLINRAAGDSGVTLLMTGAGAPEDWGVRLPDLVSRLRAAERAVLHEPDDALLRQVMEKLLRERRTPVSPGLLEYVLPRMERSVDHARALAAWLDREALARKGPVTRTLAREGLAALSSD
ncbi:MAG: hypothetical protein ACOC0V_05770 [Oceanicaulis sp.]